MMHHSSHVPLSNEVTPVCRHIRSIAQVTLALAYAWLFLQVTVAAAHDAALVEDTATCRVRYAIITLRQGPSFLYEQVRPPLKRNTTLAAVGQSEKPKWLLVETETGIQGWALVDQLQCDPLPELPVVKPPPEPKPRSRSESSESSHSTRGRVIRSGTMGSADGADQAATSSSDDAGTRAPDLPDIRFYIWPEP